LIQNRVYTPKVHDPYELFDLGDFALDDRSDVAGMQARIYKHGELNPEKDSAILITTRYSGTTRF